MLASYILKNLSEDKEESKKKGQSSTGSPGKNKDESSTSSPGKNGASSKFSEKRLVSILNYKGGKLMSPDHVKSSKKTHCQESGDKEQKEEKSNDKASKNIDHQEKKKNVRKSTNQTVAKVTKNISSKIPDSSSSSPEGSSQNISPSKGTNEDISPSQGNNENISPSKGTNENLSQSEVTYELEKTIFPVDRTIELKKCEDVKCGCRAIHCPFCETSKFKPAIPSRIINHLELKHFAYGVHYKDLLILKCYKTCFKRSECHYHCPVCTGVTFLKRIGFIRHLVAHARKEGKKSTIVRVPDTRRPKTVTINDHKIELCQDTCQKAETSKGHYHCPICNSLHGERRSIVCHVWRCEAQSKETKKSEGDGTVQGVTNEQLEKAYSMTSDLPPSMENEEIIGHASIIRTINDLPREKCLEKNCCKGKKHCVLCLTEKYKPSYLKKLKTHHYCHWNRRIQYKFSINSGYYILPCYKDCRGLLGSGIKMGHHFHCPVCGETRSRRDCFIHHLEICQGKGLPVARINFDKSNMEQMGLRELKLEEVDQSVEEEINDAMPYPQEDNDDTTEADIPMPSIGDGDYNEKEEIDLDLKSLKIFNRVTAEISNSLLSVLKSRGLDDVLEEVSGKTGVSYLFSPGINSPVHSLQGNLQTLTEATKMIEQILGIEDNRYEEKSTNTEDTYDTICGNNMSTEDTGHQEEEDFVQENEIEETPTTPDTPKRGRKRRSAKQQSDLIPVKKIKQEPADSNQYTEPLLNESIQKTPVKRYSTRGVKVDFAKLLSGKKGKEDWREEATDDRKEPGDSEGKNKMVEVEEIVIIDENKKKMNVKVPKVVASKIRQKIVNQSQTDKSETEKDDISEDDEVCEESPIKEDLDDNSADEDDDDDEDNDNSDDPDQTQFSSASTAYYVRKFKLSNSAIIPKIVIAPSSQKRASRTSSSGPSPLKRKGCNVVNKYRCTKCDFTCENFIDCTDHMIEDHSSQSILRCDVCERHFEKMYHLNIHLETKHGPHIEERLRCQYCPKEYLSTNALDHHIDTKHKNKPIPSKTSCRRCDFVGKDRHDLENHVQSNHYQVGVLCTICGKSFRNSSFLDQHMNNVHVKDEHEVKCHVCDKTFRNRRYLNEHMAIHTEEKRHACPVCGRKFHKKGNMISHKETHKNKEDRSYRFMCNYCGLKINSKANLLEHINKHTGERPFLCEICGKSFAFRTAVYKHKTYCHSTHSPFKCSICDKSFKVQRLLKQHMTTHTGKSLYKCDSCLKMFTTATTLKTHKTKCKGLHVLPQMAGNVVIFSTPKLTNAEIQIPAGESILEDQTIVENTFRVENPATTEIVVTEAESFITPEISTPTKAIMETDETSSDVAVYLCSECNAVFHDFSLAEQHVLIGHDTSANQTTMATSNEVEAVNVILKDMTDSL